ncbi:hypothetical protein M433DRAFT_58311 [Acidomyces richmondensis BFW]|nr:MAG: hypothetical protein FE78DRAFT_147581 [Acidomyces sp. 'richmondensis']KYG49878.1 hypothetical protein M433DRAFT_58311 [Acidomyces richmondensis BFW]
MGENSFIRRYGDDEVHDLICVGFGPASLAIAVALHDAVEDGSTHLRTRAPKVRFLERQLQFSWHAGMLLPGAKMQISFIKDLATLRNPRSQFTFLNYLHEKGRLVSFTNLGTFLPQRIEYQDYLKWCADYFDAVVDYGQDVQAVEAGPVDPKTGALKYFEVHSHNSPSQSRVLKAKHVVIAAGGRPSIPDCLPTNHPRIIHSSQFATDVHKMFPCGRQPLSVAVIGAGQSAAEVFDNIPSRFPDAKAFLLIRGSALRPSDDSPFVNEIFDPDRVDDVYSQNPDIRREELLRDKGTNYSVVRLELLEHIYSKLYSYRIQYSDEEQWPQRILTHREVIGVSDVEEDGQSAVMLHIQNNSGDYCAKKRSQVESLTVDLVVVASGYKRDTHEEMLRGLRPLMANDNGRARRCKVRRDYGVEFLDGVTGPDAGIWLQGCNESTHGLSDSLLSVLATRGGEMVESIFGGMNPRHCSGGVRDH